MEQWRSARQRAPRRHPGAVGALDRSTRRQRGLRYPSREKEEGCYIAVADQIHQRPEADPGQEWMTRDPDDPLRRLPDASFLADRVGFGVVKPMTMSNAARSIRMMPI